MAEQDINENKNYVKGLEEAVQLLIKSNKSRAATKRLQQVFLQSFNSQEITNNPQQNQPQQQAQRQPLNGVAVSHRIFSNHPENVTISERVSRASQSHSRILSGLDQKNYRQFQAVNQAKSSVSQKKLLVNGNEKPINEEKGKLLIEKQNIDMEQQNLESQQQIKTSIQTNMNTKEVKNIFGNIIQPNNIFNKAQPQQEKQKPQYSLFPFPKPAKADPQHSETQPPKPAFNLFTNLEPKTIFSNQNKQIIEAKTQKPSNSLPTLFNLTQNNPPPLGINLFGKPVVQMNKSQQQTKQNIQDQKNIIGSNQRLKQPEKQIQAEPSKTTPVNIFAEGLFSNATTTQQKPFLIFNNNTTNQPVIKSREDKETENPQIKLLFNNNGTVVENVKPTVDIFDGGKALHAEQQLNNTSKVDETDQTLPKEQNNQSQQKMQIQEIKEPIKHLMKQQSSSPPSNIETPNINMPQQTKPLFSNQQFFTQSFGSQASSLFSNQTIPTNSETPARQISLFGNNQITNLPQNNQNQQNKGSLFGPKLQTIKQEKTQSQGLFKKANSWNTGDISSLKPQNLLLKNQQLKPKLTSGGLFDTPTNNIFGQTIKPTPAAQPNNTFNMFAKKQQPKQERNLFTQSIQSGNTMFSKNLSSDQSSGLFKTSAPPLPSKNIFQINQSQNMFSKTSAESNIFSTPIEGNTMFKSSLNQGQNLFSKPTGGSSLFGSTQQKRGAALFEKRDDQQQDDEGSDGQGEDESQQSQQVQQNKGEMKFKNYLNTTIYAKVEATKFKIVSTGKLLEHTKFSLEKFPDSDQTIYIIVRNTNKTVIYYGILIPISQLKIISQKDGNLSISINDLAQIDVLNQNKKSKELWRIQFKDTNDARIFVDECQKIIKNLKGAQK